MSSGNDLPLIVVSTRYGRALERALHAAGWPVILVARLDEAAARFVASPASIVVVDARGARAAGLRVVAELAGDVEARGGGLLVLLSRADADAVVAAYDAGATAALTGPLSSARLKAAVRFCCRARDRLAAAARGSPPAERRALPADGLTGLATAAHTRNWVERQIALHDAPGPAMIVLQLAIGRFGQLNAAYGPRIADAVLQAVAERLRLVAAERGAGGGDRLVSRLEGAEFALVLAAPATLDEATALAHRLAQAFEVPFLVESHAIHLGCRIGIAAGPAEVRVAVPVAAERVFQQASIALTSARARPPGAIEVFRAAAGDDSLRRMADLESDLRAALEAGEVELLFQPQVETDSGRIAGVEALVRWQHPVLGQLSAETLLEVAESAEFATRLGAYIQRQALILAAGWPPALGRLRLAINVTAGDLAAPHFLAGLGAALTASGFPPNRLTLEVTESDLIENLEATAAILAQVRARGIEVALDDFGTGYSSLAYLKALPLDCLKVDKRLVGDLSGSPRDRVVVKGVVDMARALGMCVVAEGIETEAQRATAAAAGCDWYQGFLCSAPMASDALAAFVGAWRPFGGGEDAEQVAPRQLGQLGVAPPPPGEFDEQRRIAVSSF